MDGTLADCDRLRALADVGLPDPRNLFFTKSLEGHNLYPPEHQQLLQNRIDRLNAFPLGAHVPANVQVPFETAKKLHPYA
jgi:hypothetical protein